MSEQPPSFEPTDHVVLRIVGSDAISFLQTKLACDARRWRIHGGGFGVATDINGKIVFEGHFALDGDAVVAAIPQSVADEAVEHLDRYIIMEDVLLARQGDLRTYLSLGDGAAALLGRSDDEEPSRARPVDWLAPNARSFRSPGPVPGAERWWIVVPLTEDDNAADALAARGFAAAAPGALDRAEVLAGIPALGRDYDADATLPLEAGLWNGVSLSKGCYLGQEVLERLFSRGSAARRLVRFSVEGGGAPPGTVVESGGQEAGKVTSAEVDGSRAVGMMWLRRKALAEPDGLALAPDGRPVTVLGLVGGPDPEAP